MRRFLLFILASLALTDAAGQYLKFGLGTGFGFYQLNDLKEFQSELRESVPFPVKEVQNFPGYFNYSVTLEYHINDRNLIGVNAVYLTTGGRNHIGDYSGEYKLDMPANGLRVGLQYREIWMTRNKLSYYVMLRAGAMLSDLKMRETMILNEEEVMKSEYILRSEAFYGEPSMGVLYSAGKKLSLDFSIGFQADVKSKIHLKDNKEIILHHSGGEPVYMNWAGLRMALGILWNLE